MPLQNVNLALREAMSPADSLVESLHPWVAFGIMPLFALANAGVAVGSVSHGSSLAISLAVGAALVLGKPAGVLLASFVALRARVATLPSGLTARHLIVLGLVAGIGLTMSLFVADLAFAEGPLLGAAKLGVLAASGIAAGAAVLAGRLLLRSSGTLGRGRMAGEP